jgi:hypothetical protein
MSFIVICSIFSVSVCSIDTVTEIYDYVGFDDSFDIIKSINILPEDYMSFIDLLFKLLIPIVNNLFCLNIMIVF